METKARMADAMTVPGHDPIRLIIFDFDGTLSDSGDWFISVVGDLARMFRFRSVSDEEVAMLRHKTSREVIRYLGIARWKLPFLAWYVRRLVRRNVGKFRLFPDMPEILKHLSDMGVKLALVTSNSEENARRILGPENAALIACYSGGSSLFGKAMKFRRVLKQMAIPVDQTLSIGDETRDVDAAREVGMRAGAVLWGYASESALVATKPDAIFRSPAEILDFLATHRR